jgi:hypothetical protein
LHGTIFHRFTSLRTYFVHALSTIPTYLDAIKAAGKAALAGAAGGGGAIDSRGRRSSGQRKTKSSCGSRSIVSAVMNQYGLALKCGGQSHLNESLPRLLTIWFTYGETLWHELTEESKAETERSWTNDGGAHGGGKQSRRSSRSARGGTNNTGNGGGSPDDAHALLQRMCGHMNRLARMLPPEQMYSALAQLVSRICHINPHVWNTMRHILVKVISKFPSQSLWQVMGVVLSKVESRKNRAAQLMQELMASADGKFRFNLVSSNVGI